MDALSRRNLMVCMAVMAFSTRSFAASWQTVNFSVTADRPEVARQVGEAAETYRRQLAIFWLGKPLPNWSRPCRISVREGALGAGGQTTFQFVRGEVLNWRMQVQGSLERILDSVLPHEVNHTIFACHFRRPLPRWADEGAATLFEHRSEQLKQLALLNDVIRDQQQLISLRDLLSMKEYPKGQRPMLTLYAQGYALADFLVQQKGRHAYLKFIADGERSGWENAIRENFDHEGIQHLEKNWRGWVLAGMPKLVPHREQMLAAAENSDTLPQQSAARPEIQQGTVPSGRRPKGNEVVRSQSPDPTSSDGAAIVNTQHDRPSPAALTAKTQSGGETKRPFAVQAPRPRPITSQTPQTTHEEGLTDRQFEKSVLNPERSLEPTMSTTPASGVRRGEGFSFSPQYPLRERPKKLSQTPHWAEFPGQKKSF